MIQGEPSGLRSTVPESLLASCLTRSLEAQQEQSTHPRNQANTGKVTKLVHFPLLLTVQQTVMVLHAHKLCPPILLGRSLVQSELPCPHGGSTNVAHLSRLDNVVERLHGLFERRGLVTTVDLQEINVICLQALQTCVDGVENGATAETTLVDVVLCVGDHCVTPGGLGGGGLANVCEAGVC